MMRLSDEQIARAREVSLAEIVSRDVELKRAGRELRGKCPFHSERSPSFFLFSNGGERFHCFGCGAHGDVIGYVMRTRSLDFVHAVVDLLSAKPDQAPSRLPPPRPAAPRSVDDGAAVRNVLRGCGPITPTTAAHLYLWSRGLPTKQPFLLAHPGLICVEKCRPLPALVAPITNSAGEITALQRIWCSTSYLPDDAQDSRADLDTRRKSLGSMGRGAVQLSRPGAVMGIAEGVEKAIAASAMFGVSVWASCGARRMARLDLPPITEKILLFADNDDAGRAAARDGVDAYRPRQVVPMFPDPRFKDWEDQYRAEAR